MKTAELEKMSNLSHQINNIFFILRFRQGELTPERIKNDMKKVKKLIEELKKLVDKKLYNTQ